MPPPQLLPLKASMTAAAEWWPPKGLLSIVHVESRCRVSRDT